MGIRCRLSPKLRTRMKKPIGTLIEGPSNVVMERLKKLIAKERPKAVISVGDRVSEGLSQNKIPTKLSIVDNRIKRRAIQPVTLEMDRTYYVKNPPGTITDEAMTLIQKALRDEQRILIVVDGEEDLLALPSIFYAPKGSYVVYGQPDKGMVVVRVTSKKKTDISKILKTMEDFSESLNRQ